MNELLLREIQSRTGGPSGAAYRPIRTKLGLETGRRAGKIQRRYEFARRGWSILRLMPTLYVGQRELHARNSLRDGQVSGVTDAAAIGVGRSIVVMDLFSDGGRGLDTGKESQQEQYEECPCHLPSRYIGANHPLQW